MFGKPLKRQQPGKPISESQQQQSRDVAMRLSRMSTSGALRLADHPGGMAISSSSAGEPIAAVLSGSSSPYSWVPVFAAPGGGRLDFGASGGTSNAYEVNGASGLSGKEVELWATSAGDYRFQVALIGGCPEGGSLCVTVTSGCAAPNNIIAASVKLETQDTEPVTVATCTASGQVTSITRGATGSGYTNGTGYPLGISGGGGSGATGTFDVIAGRVQTVQLTSGGTGYTTAPTISFPGAGGSNATATAAILSKCCLSGIPVGTYTLSVGIPGSTKTQDVTINCKETTNASTSFASPSPGVGSICINYLKCAPVEVGNGLTAAPGSGSVTVTGTGGAVATGSVDGSGQFCVSLAAGTYSISITTSTGATFSRSGISVSSCSKSTWNLLTTDVFCGAFTTYPTSRTVNCTGTMVVYDQDGNTLGSCSITTDEFANGSCCITIPETMLPTSPDKWWAFNLFFPTFTLTDDYSLPIFLISCYPSTEPATINLLPAELCNP